MGKDFDFKKMQIEVGGHLDLVASFQNPKKKKRSLSSVGLILLNPTPISEVLEVICLEAASNHVPSSQITPSLVSPALSSSKPSSSQNLLLLGLISRA